MGLHEIYSISSLLKINLWMKLVIIDEVLYVSNPLSCFRGHLCSQTAKSTGKTNFRGQLETVLQRHLSAWKSQYPNRQIIGKVARFSVELICGDGCTLSEERHPVVWEVAHSLASVRNARMLSVRAKFANYRTNYGACQCTIRGDRGEKRSQHIRVLQVLHLI